MRPVCFANAPWSVRLTEFPRGIGKRCTFSLRRALSSTGETATPQTLLVNHFVPLPQHEALSSARTQFTSSQPSSSSLTTIGKKLPLSCPGCGALTQNVDAELAGYYTVSRRAVRNYLRSLRREERRLEDREGDGATYEILGSASQDENFRTGDVVVSEAETERTIPVCDRCHYLVHDSRGVPIAHPSVEAVADSIAESPFSRNHVYHVVDAADFPMSLVPAIQKHLSLARPRTQNRRSQHSFSTRPTLSFIITRSDLLAPTKEMVDSMMPKFTSILRTAMGRAARTLRLGNVHLVSAKRGWWTKDIKDTIRSRGGGNWLVGKFNVGKSNLFEVLFPKGTHNQAPVYAELQQQPSVDPAAKALGTAMFSETALLPPPQPEVPFPTMPLVSSLPGTTASPIRLPFGNRKGELIDMPGLERGGLDQFVRPEDKVDLVMVNRPTVSQQIIKHGQSLLIGGGVVRITPVLDGHDSSMTALAYPFVPLKSHVTSTEKAEGVQTQQRDSGVESILAEDAGLSISSAGRFQLHTDVTKSRAGSMLRAGVNLEKLPFRVYATDILIEGVGWVELVCQVRKRKRDSQAESTTAGYAQPETSEPSTPTAEGLSVESNTFTPFGAEVSTNGQIAHLGTTFPEVEIFTPKGKYIGQRPCLDIWQMWNSGKPQKEHRAARPRKPMSGAKKREKIATRSARSAGP